MKKQSFSIFFLIVLAAFLFYLPGIARAPLPGDSAIYVARADVLYLNSYAQTHPLHVALSHVWIRLFPAHPVFAMGILSAIFGALTIALIFSVTYRLSGSLWGAAAASASLMVSHTLWYHSVFPEVYSLNTFFQALIMLLLVEWHRSRRGAWLGLAYFCAALGCANHLLIGLTMIPASIWVFTIAWRRGSLLKSSPWILGGFMAGILPLGLWFLNDVHDLGWLTAAKMALVGGGGVKGGQHFSYGHAMLNLFDPWIFKQLTISLGFGIYNFAGFAIFLCVAGIAHAIGRQKGPAYLFLSIAGVHFIFGVSYRIHEHWAFLLPCWLVLPVFIGSGFESVCQSFHRAVPFLARKNGKLFLLAALLLIPPATYAFIPHLIELTFPRDRHLAQRDHKDTVLTYEEKLIFLLWPPKTSADTQARDIEQTIKSLPDGGVLFLRPSDNAIAYCLQTVDGLRPEVTVIGNSKDRMLAELLAGNRVFVKEHNEANKIRALGHDIHFVNFNDFVFEVKLGHV
ncbi:MAG: DUF2723 domain-containing protein [Lentisphaeria bacterium]|nr:DUF2723 domain-containing protein [Lentisphaeria bacterium]